MITRRMFMQSLAGAAGAASAALPIHALESRKQSSTGYFALNAAITANPDAVFIMFTDAAAETGDTDLDELSSPTKKKAAGLSFGRTVFVPSVSTDSNAFPVTVSIPIKPNLKVASEKPSTYTVKNVYSHVTDPYFMEGMIEGMKELGAGGSQFHLRETNVYGLSSSGVGTTDGTVTYTQGYWGAYGYLDNPATGATGMVTRTGVDLRTSNAGKTTSTLVAGTDYNWVDVPNGVFYNKIPYLAPLNTANSFMLNVSKLKTHGMGVTLCCKNLQGCAVSAYQKFCNDYGSTALSTYVNSTAYTAINTSFNAHLAAGVPRWDRVDYLGKNTSYNTGRGMETWATRTLDNLSALTCQLHVIEGIVAREGQGDSDYGPEAADGSALTFASSSKQDTGKSTNGKAVNHLMNVIIFGKNVFNVDIVGDYMSGHEPGNFGLYHCAKSRGMLSKINPASIALYDWNNGSPTSIGLDSLTRTPLRTYYLRKSTEDIYHLVNETYDYTSEGVNETTDTPRSFLLNQNYPNPFNPYTTIEYIVPKGGANVRLEVYNANGQLIEVIAEGRRAAGTHMAVWNAYNRASGTYFYRYRCGDFTETRKMLLLK